MSDFEMQLRGIQILLALLMLLSLPVPFLVEKQQRIRRLRAEVEHWKQELRKTLQALSATQRQSLSSYHTTPRPCDTPPPGIMPTLEQLHAEYPDDRYALPLGWEMVGDEPHIVAVSLHGDSRIKAGHMLITGETNSGKDTLAFLLASTLCGRNPPDKLQIFWVDGKRTDGALWRGKVHNWREPALGPEAVPEAMAALRAERERREQVLMAAGATRWEELDRLVQPPLLWVYISELELLTLGTKDLEQWLKTELAASRASGIRYCIATQTVSGKSTTWRSQLTCFAAGCQSARAADTPNLGMSPEEVRNLGALPPSELPAVGYFTVRVRRDVATVRVPAIALADRKTLLEALPNTPQEDTPVPAPSVAANGTSNGHSPAAPVPAPSVAANGTSNGHAPAAPVPAPSVAANGTSNGHSPAAPVPAPSVAANGTSNGVHTGAANGWTATQHELVLALLKQGEKTDRQILYAVFRIRGGSAYRPYMERIAWLREQMANEEERLSV